jgi:hypothetical protein
MRILLTIDFMLWKYFIPRLSASAFKSKLVSLCAMAYVSIYKMPRKFLVHYFKGNGKSLHINSQTLITGNVLVHEKLIKAVSRSRQRGEESGELKISQALVYRPNDKYSVGSFTVHYSVNGESVTVSICSNYSYETNSNRVTKYLHDWLCSLKQKGTAHEFEVIGNPWTVSYAALQSTKIDSGYKKFMALNYLLV